MGVAVATNARTDEACAVILLGLACLTLWVIGSAVVVVTVSVAGARATKRIEEQERPRPAPRWWAGIRGRWE